jgi:hypothetical protein
MCFMRIGPFIFVHGGKPSNGKQKSPSRRRHPFFMESGCQLSLHFVK